MSASASRRESKPTTRGAQVVISDHLFAELLPLPAGVRVRVVFHDPYAAAIVVHLEGEIFPELEEGRAPQQAWLWGHRHEDGHTTLELRMPEPTPDGLEGVEYAS